MTKLANETQIGGKHYEGTIQHWDIAAWYFGRGYFKGQITKYVYRWRKKNGVQDLEKALHFTRKLIELGGYPPPISVERFIDENKVPQEEAAIIRAVCCGGDSSLVEVEAMIEALIAAEPSRNYVDQP